MTSKVVFKIICGISVMTVLFGCSGKLPEASDWTSVALKDVPESLIVGDTLELKLRVKYGPEKESVYDFSKDDLGIKVELNSDIGEYLGRGLLKVTAPGLLKLNVTSERNEYVSERDSINVLERTYENVIGQPLNSRLICASIIMKYTSVMQTFAITGNGEFYMCGLYGSNICVQKVSVAGEADGDPMVLSDVRDCRCFSIEESAGDVWLWVCSDEGLIVREKFTAGLSVSVGDADDAYYIGEHDFIRLAVDADNDRIAIYGSSDAMVKTYSLSELKSASKDNLTGQISAADVRKSTPLESISLSLSVSDSFYMDASRYYVSVSGTTGAELTVCDNIGFSYFIRKPFAVDNDPDKLNKYALSDDGVFQPAGVVYANGSLYHGFTSTVDDETKSTIMKFGELPFRELDMDVLVGDHESFE